MERSITRLSFGSLSHPLTYHLLATSLRECGTSIQCLDLSSAPHIRLTLFALDMASYCCPSLQELNLSQMPVTASALKRLAERLPRLTSLTLESCDLEEGKKGLECAVMMLQSLKSLNVSHNHRLSGEFFSQAPQSLTKVIAEDCGLTDHSIRFLANRCPNLETIDISQCRKLTGQSITDLAENCPKLKSFKASFPLYRWNVLTSHLLTLSNLPLLEVLNVDGQRAMTDEVFYDLGRHCPLLRSISCEKCEEITDAAICHLSPCLLLETINLSFCKHITDMGVIQFSSAHPELKKVYLKSCQGITDEGVGRLLLNNPNILELDISFCYNVTDGVLPLLKSSLKRRKHAQPLKICLKGSSVNPE